MRAPTPWAALLPALDPATTGWRGRELHVDPATAAALHDRAGSGLPTAWRNGRVVGGWAQQADGHVVRLPRVPVSCAATAALERRARQLTERLDGQVLRATFTARSRRTADSRTSRGPGPAAHRAWPARSQAT